VRGLNYAVTDVVHRCLAKYWGSGECAEKAWEFLHLSLAGWMLVFFIAIIATSFALIRRDP
jgi:disulfide bond formation protein DsbB